MSRSTDTAEPEGAALARRRLLALLGVAGAGVLGAACGKRGALRLPEPTAPDAGAADEETR